MTVDPDTYRARLLKYTALAFSTLPRIDRPSILDAGCGTGVPTIFLAELSNGTVTGIDADRRALDRLTGKVRRKGFTRRVHVIHGRIEQAPFARASFDIVWAEGSISHLGFQPALEMFGHYLKRPGYLVFHDDAAEYIEKIQAVGRLGGSLLGFFLLDELVWWNEYYRLLQPAAARADSARPPYDLGEIRKQLRQFKTDPTRFRSAFFIMKRG